MARRDPADDERTGALAQDEARHPRLDLLWPGGSATLQLPETGRVVVGRSVEADLVVASPSLSRRHAVIEVGATVAWSDLGSTHGTKVRGKRLGEGERVEVAWGEPVALGDVIAIARSPNTPLGSAHAGAPTTSSMDEVERWIALVAGTDMSVLLLGETGAGKGYFARAIHARSHRARGPFLHLNCAALPEPTLESELFGHERGAFTGAAQSKPGLLESADGGTVFLDEVGELPLGVQAKLLVALERREVLRVGGLKPRGFDVRFVAATNRDLDASTKDAGFRPDLYFRLAGLPLVIPPLRERTAEILPLAQGFIADAAAKMRKPVPTLGRDAAAALVAYPWPGNVRELMTAIERAVLVSGPEITAGDVGASIHPAARASARRADDAGANAAPPPASPPAPPPQPAPPTAGAFIVVPPPAADEPTPPPSAEDELRRKIAAALEQCAGNQSRAAELLGVSRRTLINRMDELALPRPRKR